MGEGMRFANARVGRRVQPHETLGRDVRDMLDQDHPRNKWLTMRKRSQEATSDRGTRHITSHSKDLLSPVSYESGRQISRKTSDRNRIRARTSMGRYDYDFDKPCISTRIEHPMRSSVSSPRAGQGGRLQYSYRRSRTGSESTGFLERYDGIISSKGTLSKEFYGTRGTHLKGVFPFGPTGFI
ncbi:hypothetical protein GUITHDRAFT_98979 [Guillardia theta CCMP2712]|uniref:Uncharacterized protein n=1 Tax=Guillardia theta (strain CCMP2712) TaxID=905079 RepID=L1K3M0_GUITC|nr:hypothetical protein GUITHDRAFT_98979 [Guillardia theta CCMP2712]EKX55199.1 hypothetical protein GUITHDRAFT_98979 [Guillardia theta CCMP2712]|eukprot:XP_005842179.1 hypothetical protein GUITHDRAFT_98979 [Guillardia theta CCMP2712]